MKKVFFLILSLALLLTACGGSGVQTDYAPGEENRLVIYTSHKEQVYRPLVREFEERTGIWAEVVTGGTNELLERIGREKTAPRADIMFGGGVESLESCRGLFESVRCGALEDVADSFREPGDAWVPFSALPVVLIYNTKLVDPASLTGWEDLLRPLFRGRIAFADPTKSGSSFTALVTAVQACGEDFMGEFAGSLEHQLLDSSGEVLTAVADGSCLVGITLEETALQRIAAGDNIAMVYPVEGTSCVPDGTAVVLGARHRENAVRFLEFTLSREVQQLLDSGFYRRGVLEEIPSTLRPLAKIPLVDYDVQWAASHREETLEEWNRYMEGNA